MVLKTDLRQRILSKDGELYLRTSGMKVKQVKFENHTYKAIKITSGKGKYLKELNTLQSEGMSVKDNYFQLLIYENKTNETSYTVHNDQGNVIGNVENQNLNQQIESTNTVLKTLADIHDDLITSTPINTKQRSLIEEDVRPMLQSKELNNVLTEEDTQLITKYLDFIEKNRDKLAQLQNDIKYFEKEIQKSEKQLLTEENDDQRAVLKKFIDSSKAKMITTQKLIDQILVYNETQYEVINTKLKSKFTLKKLIYIFKKYGLTITAISLGLGLIIETIIRSVGISGGAAGSDSAKKILLIK